MSIPIWLVLLIGFLLYYFKDVIAMASTFKRRERRERRERQTLRDNPRRPYVPINVKTRGEEPYTQIGILSNDGVVMPLYGRPLYRGSTKWNYYTETTDNVRVRVPLEIENKDCMSFGCSELYDDDNVFIPEFNATFSVKIYKTFRRYIPL